MPYVGKKPADIIATAVDTTTGTFSGAVTVTGASILDGGVDVAGNLTLDADSGSIILKDGGTQFGLIAKTSNDLGIYASIADEDIVFKGTDGSTAITALTLDMSDAGTAIFNHDITLGSGSEISISGDSGSSGLLLRGNDSDVSIVGTHGSQPLVIRTNSAERLRVDSSGNVIIGETSQINGGNLNLATSASDAVLSFLCRSTTDSHQPEIIMQKSSTASGNFAATADGEALGSIAFRGVDTQPVSQIAGAIDVVQDGTASGSVPATMRFSVGGTERMRLQADGTLSVGVTGDTDAIIYASRGDAGNTIFSESSSSATSGVRSIVSSIGQNANNTNCQHLRATTQNVSTFRLDGNGASTFSSDERLKKNIETTRDGYLEDLAKLRVVKYNWHNADVSTDKELGLIAQEVQKVFPKLVVEDDESLNGIEKPLALKVSVLPMMLLKALQEANTKITALEGKVAKLEGA